MPEIVVAPQAAAAEGGGGGSRSHEADAGRHLVAEVIGHDEGRVAKCLRAPRLLEPIITRVRHPREEAEAEGPHALHSGYVGGDSASAPRPAQSDFAMRGHMRSPPAWSARRIARSAAASTRPPSTTKRPSTETRAPSSSVRGCV